MREPVRAPDRDRIIMPGELGYEDALRIMRLMPVGGSRRCARPISQQPFKDTFTEASPPVLLSAHTPDIGTSWAAVATSTAVWTINPTGECYPTTVDNVHTSVFLATPGSSSANYTVSATIKVVSSPSTSVQLIGRYVDATHFYQVAWYPWAPELDLFDGAGALLATTGTGVGGSNGSSHSIALIMTGTAISVTFDGVSKLSVTNSQAVGPGKGGVGYGSPAATSSTGYHFTLFQVV